MDTRPAAEVELLIGEIKAYMPETYAAIQAKAQEIGREAYAIVRAGLRGEPNRFWAMEKGRVMGTPFNQLGLQEEVAVRMVHWGCAYACIFGQPVQEVSNGTN